ncbi:MAG: hypothetical protein R3B39_02140 [Candidatus Paceibacterota bacterium]
MEEKILNMWSALKKFYDYLITFPERLYPFNEKTQDGKILTGEKAYKYLADITKINLVTYSLQSPKLLFWQQVFHFLGSVLLVLVAHLMFIHLSFFNGLAFLILVVLSLAVQEFYFHPHYYNQKPHKTLIDFFTTWMLPILIYIIL